MLNKTEEFIEKAIKIHGDRYDYSKVIYEKSLEKVEITCKEHGLFLQTPSKHLSGQGCRKCYFENKTKKSNEVFIEECIKIHGSKYDYSSVIYDSCNKNINIICKEH